VPGIQGSVEKDATGCGDQVTATMAAALTKGYSMEKSAELAIITGTLQFNRPGIKPINSEEILI